MASLKWRKGGKEKDGKGGRGEERKMIFMVVMEAREGKK